MSPEMHLGHVGHAVLRIAIAGVHVAYAADANITSGNSTQISRLLPEMPHMTTGRMIVWVVLILFCCCCVYACVFHQAEVKTFYARREQIQKEAEMADRMKAKEEASGTETGVFDNLLAAEQRVGASSYTPPMARW
mmetsp:Transcript_13419/g.31541  ORF Transcript_13419/g.31541 Transcript_13419/m.31541 type:complete len:136 (+) Transcript_13419:42-449(+)|eukprot:CAMPEP_0178428542 /NCGR_PEP_ID=MMETSP0689_2-20121128/30334_1 /TAXON_ID=160604 /ORGANISM="Amphidinium massartii, Strain CS-259" /LENGTH=135 /DNA_ID=CAMNT_0020050323 /DNA_START=22 /DNA_END=429 /DNA_ORIENTATION=+